MMDYEEDLTASQFEDYDYEDDADDATEM
jgi:hypothetical protein